MSIVEEIKSKIVEIDKELKSPINEKRQTHLLDLKKVYENRLSILLDHEKTKEEAHD